MKTYKPNEIISSDIIFDSGTVCVDANEAIIIQGNNFVVDGQGTELVSSFKPKDVPSCLKTVFFAGGGVVLGEHYLSSKYISVDTIKNNSICTFAFGYYGDISLLEISAKDREKREVATTTFREVEVGNGGFIQYESSLDLSALSTDFTLHVKITMEEKGFYLIDKITASLLDLTIWNVDPNVNIGSCYNVGFSLLKTAEYKEYQGTAIRMIDCQGVTLRNFSAMGFASALIMENCIDCTVEGNDFSDNYHDTEYGWGDGIAEYGGIIMIDCHNNIIRKNKALRVWNGLVLTRSHKNIVEGNTISHCSNVCLKLSYAKGNTIQSNDFSWGLRMYPEEVHARDSVSCLMENGSDNNKIIENNFSHGGDGVFIRVLNNWCSLGNYFLRNNCSYANNNAIESWSPRNVYEENEASFSSYGFWLGGSDETVLKRNRIVSNGSEFLNAPEPFGNAGIAVVNGSCEGMLMSGNLFRDNQGPALALGANCTQKVRCWLIRDNAFATTFHELRGFKGDGMYIFQADHIWVGANSFENIQGCEISVGDQVSNLNLSLQKKPYKGCCSPQIEATSEWIVGSPVFLSVDCNDGDGYWLLGEKQQRGEHAEFFLDKPGYHRAFYMSGQDVSWHSFYVLPKGEFIKGQGRRDIIFDSIKKESAFSVFEINSSVLTLTILWTESINLSLKSLGFLLLFNHEAEITSEGRIATFIFHSPTGARKYQISLPQSQGTERYTFTWYSFFKDEPLAPICEDENFDPSQVTSITVLCDAKGSGMGELIVDAFMNY